MSKEPKKVRLTLLDGTLPSTRLGKFKFDFGKKPKKRRKSKGNYKSRLNKIRNILR